MAAWDDHRCPHTVRGTRRQCQLEKGHQDEYIAPDPSVDTLPACWEFFTDDALIELLADTSYELGRRGVRVLVG